MNVNIHLYSPNMVDN